jgi:site-specific recombinase XerD
MTTAMEAPSRAASGVTLQQAITSLLFAKSSANYRPSYVRSLRQYLTLFAKGREGLTIESITVFDLEEWFSIRKESQSSQASNVGKLSACFSFAMRRGWRKDNPCDQLERVRIDQKTPTILSVDQCATLMKFAKYSRPSSLAFFSLALFAGIRPEELQKVTWGNVDLVNGIVTIDAATSKVRRRRLVHLEPNALEWMQFASDIDARLPFLCSSRRRTVKAAARGLGFDGWPQDVMRHTAASQWLAKTHDVARVAKELGNSPEILLRHYHELVSAKDCLAFWSIKP